MPFTLHARSLAGPSLRQVHRTSSSTSTSHRYPYPTCQRPTPHQIFHLEPGANQKDIKARYYDLVRLHHPDSPSCRHLTASQRHARFQSITAAYDTLRGRRTTVSPWPGQDEMEVEIARRRAYQQYRRRSRPPSDFDLDGNGREWVASADDRMKDRLILIIAGVAFLVAFSPFVFTNPFVVGQERHRLAAANLAEARREAQEVGQERRKEIRRIVEEHRQRMLEAQEKDKREGSDA